MLLFSPRLSTFSWVFACKHVMSNQHKGFPSIAVCFLHISTLRSLFMLQVCTAARSQKSTWALALMLTVLGWEPSSRQSWSRIFSLCGLSFGCWAMMVISTLPSWYPLSCISRTCYSGSVCIDWGADMAVYGYNNSLCRKMITTCAVLCADPETYTYCKMLAL